MWKFLSSVTERSRGEDRKSEESQSNRQEVLIYQSNFIHLFIVKISERELEF